MSWQGVNWARKGVELQLPAQSFNWQPGQSSVLYLHFENLLSPENSRGPKPTTSTCVAKLSLDPTSPVNNVIQTEPIAG